MTAHTPATMKTWKIVPTRRLRRLQLGPFELELGFPDVNERSQFVNIRIAVIEQGIECVDVERGWCRLGSNGAWGIQEVIVAIDQNVCGICWDNLRQFVLC